MQRKINLIALVAGISTLLLIAVSVFVPWWQFTVGKPAFAQVNFSPVNLNFSILGNPLTVPLIWAMNLACILNFGFRRHHHANLFNDANQTLRKASARIRMEKTIIRRYPLCHRINCFIDPGENLFRIRFPLMGSAILTLPSTLTSGSVNISFSVLGEFGWPFYFAFVVAGLCVAARLYHRKIPLPLQPAPPSPPINSPSP